MRPRIADLAEEPGASLPDDGVLERIPLDGMLVALYAGEAAVDAIRLAAGAVDGGLASVRELARARGIGKVTWWLGGLTQPRGLEGRLAERGLVPDPSGADLTTVAITRKPGGEPTLEVRPVEDEAAFRAALELDWEVFGRAGAERERRRGGLGEAWLRACTDTTTMLHLAYLDGRPAAMARTVFTPHGGLMLGGATLPEARGRGAYTSIVHARWEEAVARGTPALGTAAGPMSAPVLAGLGFEEHGRVRLLLDRL